MFLVNVTTVKGDGTQETVKLNPNSLLEFEALENISLVKALDEDVHMRHLYRLSWLASRQSGLAVPASLEEYVKSIQTVGYKLEIIPFGETESTASTQNSSSQESPTTI